MNIPPDWDENSKLSVKSWCIKNSVAISTITYNYKHCTCTLENNTSWSASTI